MAKTFLVISKSFWRNVKVKQLQFVDVVKLTMTLQFQTIIIFAFFTCSERRSFSPGKQYASGSHSHVTAKKLTKFHLYKKCQYPQCRSTKCHHFTKCRSTKCHHFTKCRSSKCRYFTKYWYTKSRFLWNVGQIYPAGHPLTPRPEFPPNPFVLVVSKAASIVLHLTLPWPLLSNEEIF